MQMRLGAWCAAAMLVASLVACGGDPESGQECSFQETGDVFCAGGGKVLECTFVDAERQWTEVAQCSSGTTCRETDDFRGYACE